MILNKLLVLLLVCFSFKATCQNIRVGIFNHLESQASVISCYEGKYKVFGDNEFIKYLERGEALYISVINNKLILRDFTGVVGEIQQIKFMGVGKYNSFRVKYVPGYEQYRIYEDNLEVNLFYGRMQLINDVAFENYIAGVVEAECGINRAVEFYKAMAVISRTYALKHLNKHAAEAFHVCDEVHCQVYKSRSHHDAIIEAAKLTLGEVIINSDTNLITAAFHSNCGGQTANSEDVWLKAVPYLRAVKDPYCLNMPNARWRRTIPVEEWMDYLDKKGVNINRVKKRGLELKQRKRHKHYTINNHPILMTTIRKDWKLPSALFSIKKEREMLVLEGQGYGHGVGMCQEGAMQMAEKNFSYYDIINHYYKNVRVIELFKLDKMIP
jgi:stage II sporulation protein D